MTLGVTDATTNSNATFVAGGASEATGSDDYLLGPAAKPEIKWDDDFVYNSAEPELKNYVSWSKWRPRPSSRACTLPDVVSEIQDRMPSETLLSSDALDKAFSKNGYVADAYVAQDRSVVVLAVYGSPE